MSQLETANTIHKLRSLGISIKDIKQILLDKTEEQLKQYLNLRLIEVQDELQKIHNIMGELNHYIQTDFTLLPYCAIRKTIPKRNVISLRSKIKNYMVESILWNELYNYMSINNIQSIDDGYVIAVFHDTEYKEIQVDIEVQVSVDRIYDDDNNIRFYKTRRWMWYQSHLMGVMIKL